jgi:hypothetical protein
MLLKCATLRFFDDCLAMTSPWPHSPGASRGFVVPPYAHHLIPCQRTIKTPFVELHNGDNFMLVEQILEATQCVQSLSHIHEARLRTPNTACASGDTPPRWCPGDCSTSYNVQRGRELIWTKLRLIAMCMAIPTGTDALPVINAKNAHQHVEGTPDFRYDYCTVTTGASLSPCQAIMTERYKTYQTQCLGRSKTNRRTDSGNTLCSEACKKPTATTTNTPADQLGVSGRRPVPHVGVAPLATHFPGSWTPLITPQQIYRLYVVSVVYDLSSRPTM